MGAAHVHILTRGGLYNDADYFLVQPDSANLSARKRLIGGHSSEETLKDARGPWARPQSCSVLPEMFSRNLHCHRGIIKPA